MNIVAFVGVLIIVALSLGHQLEKWGVPRILGYLLAGTLFSPAALGSVYAFPLGPWVDYLSSLALGIVAYLIGGSMTMPQLKRIGKTVILASLGEALGAIILVFCCLALFHKLLIPHWQLSHLLLLSAVAATTDAAANLAVIHQYRAQGALTQTLLGVIALDDALGIVAFSLILPFAGGMSLGLSLGTAAWEVLGALLLGGGLAWAVKLFSLKMQQEQDVILPLLLGCIFLAIGFAESLGFSALLAAMSLGFFMRYFQGASGERHFAPIEALEDFTFLLFFVLAGTHFDLSVFLGSSFFLVLIYLLARVIGKFAGAFMGVLFSGTKEPKLKYVGLGLVPQAGVALGLLLSLSHHEQFQDLVSVLLNIVVATTLCNEILGPLATKFALKRAGEIKQGESHHASR